MGAFVDVGAAQVRDGYRAQVVFADPFTEVPGCPAATIGP